MRSRPLAFLFAVSAMSAACGDAATGTGDTGTGDADATADVADTSTAHDGVAEQLVGPDGAVLEAGVVTVTVPAGALADAVVLRLSVATSEPPRPGPNATVLGSPIVTLTPHGQAFDAPVTVRLPYDPAAVRSPALYRLDDEEDTTWSHVPATFDDGMVTAQLDGFSVYAVFGVPPAGGVTFYITSTKPCDWIDLTLGTTTSRLRGNHVAPSPPVCGDVGTGTTFANRSYDTYAYSASCEDEHYWSGFVVVDEECVLLHLD